MFFGQFRRQLELPGNDYVFHGGSNPVAKGIVTTKNGLPVESLPPEIRHSPYAQFLPWNITVREVLVLEVRPHMTVEIKITDNSIVFRHNPFLQSELVDSMRQRLMFFLSRMRSETEILRLTSEIYQQLFDAEPEITAIHAGLECGIIERKNPHLDMIFIGLKIRNAHSPLMKKLKSPRLNVFGHC